MPVVSASVPKNDIKGVMSRLDVSGETAISMPMKNILRFIIGAVTVGVGAYYFGVLKAYHYA